MIANNFISTLKPKHFHSLAVFHQRFKFQEKKKLKINKTNLIVNRRRNRKQNTETSPKKMRKYNRREEEEDGRNKQTKQSSNIATKMISTTVKIK